MKRRDFLKKVACTSALATGQVISTNVSKAFAASDGASLEARSTAPAGQLDRATFDFYVEHKTLLVASTADEEDRTAEFEIIVNPIGFNPNEIKLELVPVNVPEGFAANLNSRRVTVRKSGRQVKCSAVLPAGVEEGRESIFKLVGTRGREEETVTLRVITRTAAPRWELGHSKTKVAEQPLKVTRGEPVRYHLSLANSGHLEDKFELKAVAPEGWAARFTDERGNPLSAMSIGPVQGIFQWEDPRDVWLEVEPLDSAESKKTIDIVARARSRRTGKEDEIVLKAFLSPPLFSINDLDGLDPRPHYVQASAVTTYVLHLYNSASRIRNFKLVVEGAPEGWTVSLPENAVDVGPKAEKEVVLQVTPPPTARNGDSVTFTVLASDDIDDEAGIVRLGAEVYDLPKIYLLVIDSLDYAYLTLNRKGDGPGAEGDWLCPNIREFLAEGCSYTNAHCGMPAATDMNHTTIASGATTGDLGAYWVSGLYAGTDVTGDIIVVRPNPDILRYGPEGKKLERIFDLVQQRFPFARSFVVSNKAWVSALHEDGKAVRWGVTGSHFPVYATAPPPYVLGDPPTDDDKSDRAPVKPPELMVNLSPLDLLPQILHGDFDLLKPAFLDVGRYVGGKPGFFPNDAWIARTTCRVIREEDPEVLYLNLAAVDEAGHVFGAAWDPDEWSKANGFFNSYWVSKYSEQARRDEILDAVREADARLAEVLSEIKARGAFENSIVVFTADHSMVTEGYRKQKYVPIDIKEYLRAQGIISPKHYGTTWSLNHYAAVFDVRDEETLQEIKRQLQGMTVTDPEYGEGFHPCIALDAEGMRTGIDSDNPYLSDEEKRIAEPMELYSSYYMENDPENIPVRWPDLFVFFRGRYQGTVPGDAVIKGVNGVGERMPVFRRTGSRWVGIHGSEGTTHVPLVFHGPAIQKGIEFDQPATLHDIIPTVCHMTGLRAPETAAGRVRKEILSEEVEKQGVLGDRNYLSVSRPITGGRSVK